MMSTCTHPYAAQNGKNKNDDSWPRRVWRTQYGLSPRLKGEGYSGLFMGQSENGVTCFSFDGYGNRAKNSVQISRHALASGSRGTVG